MMTLILPSFGGGVNVERTIESCRHVCDEVVIISTAFFSEDQQHFRRIADKVVELPWNFTFLHGHGELHNQATALAKNDWLLLLGTAETFAEPLMPVAETLASASPREMFRCNHHNDPHSWKRVWNRTSGVHWSGIMHEELTGGDDGRLLFRMQDTEKTPSLDAFKDEARRWVKGLVYNLQYYRLLKDPSLLGAASTGWLKFVKGAEESITKYCEDNQGMLRACIEGDLPRFLKLVEQASQCREPYGVNFKPQGYESLIA
jgi:hypothetical protein